MMNADKHPYDHAGQFICWTTSVGIAVAPVDRPTAFIEVISREAQQALRWGTNAGLAAGERLAAQRYNALRTRERSNVHRTIAALPGCTGLTDEPLKAFEISTQHASYGVAAPDRRVAICVLVQDSTAMADLADELERGLKLREILEREQDTLRFDDLEDGADTLFAVLRQLNDQRALPLICARRER